MTAVLSGLTQPIEQESLLHRKPASRTTVRVPTGTRQPDPQGQNRQSVFLKFTGYGLDNRSNLREHYCDNYLVHADVFFAYSSVSLCIRLQI